MKRGSVNVKSVMITTHNKLKDHDNLKHERVNYECDDDYNSKQTEET